MNLDKTLKTYIERENERIRKMIKQSEASAFVLYYAGKRDAYMEVLKLISGKWKVKKK